MVHFTIPGDIGVDNQKMMNELAKNDLAEMFVIFSKNGIKANRMWSLSKKDLDQLRVPYHLLKRYLQKIPQSGNLHLYDRVILIRSF